MRPYNQVPTSTAATGEEEPPPTTLATGEERYDEYSNYDGGEVSPFGGF